MKIKTGDKVRVMSGKDKGKEGKVTQVLPKHGMVVVEGINNAVRHVKARGAQQPGQRVTYQAPIAIQKVALLNSKGAGRTGYKMVGEGKDAKKVRVVKKAKIVEEIG